MKKSRTSRVAYTLALAAMATTLASLQALADDDMGTSQAVAPTTNSIAVPPTLAMPAQSPAMPATEKVLGTVSTSATSPAAMPWVVPPATEASMVHPAEVPPVAPVAMPDSSAGVLPQQKAGDITYITGGVGDEERAALGEAKKNYNLYIMSSEKDGAFLGDTNIIIRADKDKEVLNTTAGPLLYVKIPAGTYFIEESRNGQTKKEKVTIGTKGASNLQFNW